MIQGTDPRFDPLLRLPNTFRPFYGAFAGLRPVQIKAINPILEGRDLIVQAATGSGKSEAVLAPALERVITSGRAHGVLYIIPTRALAKDLMRRFEPIITERLNLVLAIRTGDIKKGGTQVIRFLALLELGRRGKIETPTHKKLPSVLSQQVISCLYEKKEISLNAVKNLFPKRSGILPDIFKSLEKKGWLRRTRQSYSPTGHGKG